MLKITNVQAFLLSYPFEAPIKLHYHGGERTIMKRDAMLIRVETDKGVIGYAPGQGSESAKRVIDDIVAPFLVGRALGDTDALRVLFLKSAGTDDYAAKMYTVGRDRATGHPRQVKGSTCQRVDRWQGSRSDSLVR